LAETVSSNRPQCYQLLLKTSAGYHIDLNNTFAAQKQIGWPTIQIQVLQELVKDYVQFIFLL
jgi:hypothetical protein